MINFIKDARGRVIGMEQSENGIVIIKDAYGRNLGNYNEETGWTKDCNGRIIGRGNLTMMLLK